MKLLLCLLMPAMFLTEVVAKANIHTTITDTTSAATIINRSETAYQNQKLYLDSGKVIKVMQYVEANERKRETTNFFKTAYANDGSFNFECYELGKSNSLYIINRVSGRIKTWLSAINKIAPPSDIDLALIIPSGFTSNSSIMLPSLLVMSSSFNIYSRAKVSSVDGAEMVGNVDCYKIESIDKRIANYKTIFWIAKKDYLIRKIEVERIMDSKTMVQSLDSLVQQLENKKSTGNLKKDSVNTRIIAHFKLLSAETKKGITIKETYFYYPYSLENPSPDLFKFRTNREMGLGIK